MLIKPAVLGALEKLIHDEQQLQEINAWVLETEPALVEWTRNIARIQVEKWDNGMMQIPSSIAQQIEGLIHRGMNLGFVISTLGINAQYDDEIDTDRIKRTALANPDIYRKWLNGDMDSSFYEVSELDINIDDLGEDWTTATQNYKSRISREKKNEAKASIIRKGSKSGNTLKL